MDKQTLICPWNSPRASGVQSISFNSYFIIPSSRLCFSPRWCLLKSKCSLYFPRAALLYIITLEIENTILCKIDICLSWFTIHFLYRRWGSETLTLLKSLGGSQFSLVRWGLQLWEVNIRQREVLWAFLTGRGTARCFYPFCGAFVLEQFPWCLCFVCRPVCRQHSSQTHHTRWFYEAVHRLAWLRRKAVAQAARHQLPQIFCRLSHGHILRKYGLMFFNWRERYRWCYLRIQLSLLLVMFGKLK